MLAPEVWEFDPPSSTLKIQEGVIDSPEKIENLIKSHPFNHLVSVVLPDTPQVPQSIFDSLSSDNEYYKAEGVNAHEFVEKEFIDAFVKKGYLSAVSVDCNLDLDNCMSLSGGHLVLSLSKDSYQELGLEGKPVVSKNKYNQRYIVSIDLKTSHFRPGKKNYERAYDCLKNHLQSFNIVFMWEPDDEKVCPSSVASYFSARGLNVQVCQPSFHQRRDFNVAVPQLYPPDKACDIEEVIEWLGSFSLNVQSTVTPETEFLSAYSGPEETVSCGQVALLVWRGFFTISQVTHLFKALSEYFLDRNEVPWVSLYVQGFADVPVAWSHRPHVFFTDGDNSFAVILKPKNAFISASHYSNNKLIK